MKRQAFDFELLFMSLAPDVAVFYKLLADLNQVVVFLSDLQRRCD